LRKREMVIAFERKREIDARLLCQRGRDGRLFERESNARILRERGSEMLESFE